MIIDTGAFIVYVVGTGVLGFFIGKWYMEIKISRNSSIKEAKL